MVDGVLLLVDASEGPLPQTRFVLRKALESRLPVVLVVNKVDRPDARIAEVVDEVYELFLDLDADETQIDFPIVYRNAKRARRRSTPGRGRTTRTVARPAGRAHPRAALRRRGHRCRRTSRTSTPRRTSAASRSAACPGDDPQAAQQVAWCRADGTIERVRITELFVTEALDRVPAEEAGPGEIIAVAGIPDITIGETLADAEDPAPTARDHGRRADPLDDDRDQHVAAVRQERQEADGDARSRPGSTPSWSATCRCGCCRPSARTRGRCRAAASCSWPCWSS